MGPFANYGLLLTKPPARFAPVALRGGGMFHPPSRDFHHTARWVLTYNFMPPLVWLFPLFFIMGACPLARAVNKYAQICADVCFIMRQ